MSSHGQTIMTDDPAFLNPFANGAEEKIAPVNAVGAKGAREKWLACARLALPCAERAGHLVAIRGEPSFTSALRRGKAVISRERSGWG